MSADSSIGQRRLAAEAGDYRLKSVLPNTRLLNGRWVPTFPNARYLFAREEWEHWRVAELRAAYTTDPYYEDSRYHPTRTPQVARSVPW